MQCNVGITDRILRITAGSLLIILLSVELLDHGVGLEFCL